MANTATGGALPARLLAPPKLTVEDLPPGEIKPDPRNARTHPKSQLKQLADSMRAFGFTNPLLIDEDRVLIAGHGRLLAAKQLGLESVPTITLRGLSEIEKRALRLADNKLASNAGWDEEKLRIELQAPSLEASFDFGVIGFAPGEVDVKLATKLDVDDEVVPATPDNPRARLGDIFQLGEHRVGCGDTRNDRFVGQLLGAWNQADVAFLDPPYNVAIGSHANVKSAHPEFVMASGEMSDDQFAAFLRDSLKAAIAYSRPGAVHFVCMDWRHGALLEQVGTELYGALLNVCVWNKSNAGMGALYRSKQELIYVFKVGDKPHFNAVELGRHGRNRTNVWDYPSVNSLKGSRREDLKLHPTVKPVALVADAIKDVSRRGDVVLDTFLGSGTSLIAAEREGRVFRGADISPLYVDIAIERWEAMTGGEAVLLNRGDGGER